MAILDISITNILLWALVGILAGYIAHVRDQKHGVSGGIVATSIFGCLGAVTGGYLASFLMGRAMLVINLEGLLVAVIGAMILAIFFRSSFRNNEYFHTKSSQEER